MNQFKQVYLAKRVTQPDCLPSSALPLSAQVSTKVAEPYYTMLIALNGLRNLIVPLLHCTPIRPSRIKVAEPHYTTKRVTQPHYPPPSLYLYQTKQDSGCRTLLYHADGTKRVTQPDCLPSFSVPQ